ncbi:MAG: FlgO family outer membrane protein [Thermodesulfobacteriota bacterium]|nr:FlgO family outer membrane protein [Thermodesulfobacteriota bacterium]
MFKKYIFSFSAVLFFAVLTMHFLSCTDISSRKKYVKDGKEYGVTRGLFRERWWNFYERGNSFSEGGFWTEAVADYKNAIDQRDKDQRKARTYGLHFTDYFPHRDLGVAYYHLGKYEDAKKELELSLSQVDTAKAKFYLNSVRKALIEKANADTAPPDINVSSLAGGEITNNFRLQVEGEVKDDSFAHKVAINDEPLFIELSAKKIPFSREIKLKKGFNDIKIKTSDLLGKITEKKLKVFADFEGPLLNIKNFVDGQKVAMKKIVLNGALSDAAGITTLKINEKVLAYNKERDVEFSFAIALSEGNNKIAIAAADITGNTTTGELNLTYVPKLALKNPYIRGPVLLAFLGDKIGSLFNHQFAAVPADITPPKIKVKDYTKEQTVFLDSIFLQGQVSDMGEVQTVSINGEVLNEKPGKNIYFNYLTELNEGKNTFKIETFDSKGNKQEKTIAFIKKPLKVLDVGSRLAMAVLPFNVKGDESGLGDIVYDLLVNSVVEQERFNVVSRGEELEKVLNELKLSKTALVSKDAALKVGRVVAAEVVVMGTYHETPDSIEVFARLINTETSGILAVEDVFDQNKNLSQLRYNLNGLATKFKSDLPLIQGMVIKLEGDKIYIDAGLDQNLKKEMKFIAYREGEVIKHPITGKILGADTEVLGEIRLEKVFEDFSLGKIIKKDEKEIAELKVKDQVITK